MESTTYDIEQMLNFKGCTELIYNGYIKSNIKSNIQSVLLQECKIDNDKYFNILISLSEYSFCNKKDFNMLFHYDYSNNIDYEMIYTLLSNPLIKSPIYDGYCNKHQNNNETCLNCLERYRIVTRNLIPIIKKFRKDLCSIYFIDMLYDLIRFENRNLYSLLTYLINNHKDGSSFKQIVNTFGRKKIVKLFKTINKPFRRIDYKLIFKKYLPLIYNVYLYCDKQYIDNKDNIYDFMLYKGLSMFKTVPSKYIVVGYQIGEQYKLDIIKTKQVLDFNDINFKIGSHDLLEGINFGFYKERHNAYIDVLNLYKTIKENLKPIYSKLIYTGYSVFTQDKINSENCITIGFLKKSENTFQNFRLDIHIESFLTNNKKLDYLRTIGHNKWK